MATININSSTNIGSVSYVAGDTLAINPANGANLVRLTIDAQVPADVTKVEGTLMGTLSLQNASEVYTSNTSTSTPIIVKLASEIYDIIMNSRRCKIKTRGDFIPIGTGTGAIGQTASTIVGGKSIDWPTFVEVETSAGSGVYVQYLNINGNRPNSLGNVPTGYRTFADVGTNETNGAFFEYNEQTNTIYFATATGGYAPPSGANIRIPNIHFTVAGVPNTTIATRSIINPSQGVLDLENTNFSNRWTGAFQSCTGIRIVHSNIPLGLNLGSGIKEFLYFDYCATTLDVYIAANGSSSTWNWVLPSGSMYVRNFKQITQGSSLAFFIQKGADVQSIYFYCLNRTSINYSATISGADAENSYKYIKNIYSMGLGMIYQSLGNCFIENIYGGDRLNSTNLTTNAVIGITLSTNVRNCIFKTIREVSGCAKYYNGFMSLTSNTLYNVAIIDAVYDCASHCFYGLSIDRSTSQRVWIYNLNFTNTRLANASLNASNPNGRALNSIRVLRSDGSSINALGSSQMMLVKHNSVTPLSFLSGNNNNDLELAHITRTSTSGSGVMTLLFGSKNTLSPSTYVVNSGVEDIDFAFGGSSLAFLTTNAQIEWTSNYPCIGVTSMASAVVPSYVNMNIEFKLRNNRPTEDWGASWSTLNTANLRSAFASLSNYSQYDGFHVKVRITPTATASINVLDVTSVTVNEAFPAIDIGYAEVSGVNLETGSVVALAETVPSDRIVNYAIASSNTQYFEFPHYYDGTNKNYKAIARKVGYTENIISGSMSILGLTLPLTVTPAWAATNASVAGIAIDGSLKTIVVTGSKTFQEVYQQSQYWSCLSSNLLYDIPMASNDGETFTVPNDWTITWSLPTDKVLSGGRLIVTPSGAYSFKLDNTTTVFATGGLYDFSDCQLSGTIKLENTSGSPVEVILQSGVSYTNIGPNITVSFPTTLNTALISNIVAGSRLRVYNQTTSTEIVNQIIPGTTWSLNYTEGSDFSDGDIVKITIQYTSGLTSKLEFTQTTIASASGWAVLAAQEEDTVYTSYAINGSTITKFTADYTNDEVDLVINSNFTASEFYAWWKYNLTTENGVRDFSGGLTAVDVGNIKANTAILNLYLDNITATNLVQMDNIRIYRSDETYPVKNPTTGGGGIDVNWRNQIFVAETGTSGLTPSESAKLDAVATMTALSIVNENVKDASLLIPADRNI